MPHLDLKYLNFNNATACKEWRVGLEYVDQVVLSRVICDSWHVSDQSR